MEGREEEERAVLGKTVAQLYFKVEWGNYYKELRMLLAGKRKDGGQSEVRFVWESGI